MSLILITFGLIGDLAASCRISNHPTSIHIHIPSHVHTQIKTSNLVLRLQPSISSILFRCNSSCFACFACSFILPKKQIPSRLILLPLSLPPKNPLHVSPLFSLPAPKLFPYPPFFYLFFFSNNSIFCSIAVIYSLNLSTERCRVCPQSSVKNAQSLLSFYHSI